MADDDAVLLLAQQIYAEQCAAEVKGHRQGIVPWAELGESYRVSLMNMARDRLEAADGK